MDLTFRFSLIHMFRQSTCGCFLNYLIYHNICCKDLTTTLAWHISRFQLNLVPGAWNPREGTWGSGIIRFGEESDWPLIWNAQFNLSQDSWLPPTDYPRASRSFPRIAGSGNEIGFQLFNLHFVRMPFSLLSHTDTHTTTLKPNQTFLYQEWL
jgi:hypothetical protein